jgi:hypothetical protein
MLPSSKVGTGELETKLRGSPLGLLFAAGAAVCPKAGAASRAAEMSVNATSRIDLIKAVPPASLDPESAKTMAG